MARRDDSPIGLLLRETVRAPWPVGIVLAGVVYALFAFILPAVFDEDVVVATLVAAAQSIAHWLAIPFLICSIVSFFGALNDRRLLDKQEGIDSIRELTWQEFERLLAEAFRRQGYQVRVTPSGSDGGVDLVLERLGQTILVQAKQWRQRKVGVKTVRELFGVVQADGATGGIVATSGGFTKDAYEFAGRSSIDLIDGERLARMIDSVSPNAVALPAQAPASPSCPSCGEAMVLRTARRGTNVGKQFWGCRAYPRCRGTRDCD